MAMAMANIKFDLTTPLKFSIEHKRPSFLRVSLDFVYFMINLLILSG
jgi:hypothetical protein